MTAAEVDVAAASVDIIPLTRDWLSAYQRFARQAFGARAYQAREGYLRWLYDESAHAQRGLGDATLAICGGEVIGCFHKMRLPWQMATGVEIVASPNNLMVAAGHRTGAGAGLIFETFRGEKHLLLLGAGSAAQPIYERLGCRPLATHWFQTILNPMSAPLVAVLAKLAPGGIDRVLALACALVDDLRLPGTTFEVHRSVGETLASEIADLLERGAGSRVHVRWSADLVRWRFFAAAGPRHLLVRAGARALAIVSLGVHRGLAVARIVEWEAEDDASAQRLGLGLRALLTALGVNACLATSTEAAKAQQWRRAGFWPVRDAPRAFELHAPRRLSFGPISFGGGAGDYGFEALPFAPS